MTELHKLRTLFAAAKSTFWLGGLDYPHYKEKIIFAQQTWRKRSEGQFRFPYAPWPAPKPWNYPISFPMTRQTCLSPLFGLPSHLKLLLLINLWFCGFKSMDLVNRHRLIIKNKLPHISSKIGEWLRSSAPLCLLKSTMSRPETKHIIIIEPAHLLSHPGAIERLRPRSLQKNFWLSIFNMACELRIFVMRGESPNLI